MLGSGGEFVGFGGLGFVGNSSAMASADFGFRWSSSARRLRAASSTASASSSSASSDTGSGSGSTATTASGAGSRAGSSSAAISGRDLARRRARRHAAAADMRVVRAARRLGFRGSSIGWFLELRDVRERCRLSAVTVFRTKLLAGQHQKIVGLRREDSEGRECGGMQRGFTGRRSSATSAASARDGSRDSERVLGACIAIAAAWRIEFGIGQAASIAASAASTLAAASAPASTAAAAVVIPVVGAAPTAIVTAFLRRASCARGGRWLRRSRQHAFDGASAASPGHRQPIRRARRQFRGRHHGGDRDLAV